jgi:hypothetical protein
MGDHAVRDPSPGGSDRPGPDRDGDERVGAPEQPGVEPLLDASGRDTGDRVDPRLRRRVEDRLGTGLGDVRLHAGPAAALASAAIGARAFTHGADIVLGAGEAPDDGRLLAHELVHVAQQRAGGVATQRKVAIGAAADPAEAQADSIADEVGGGLAGSGTVHGAPHRPGRPPVRAVAAGSAIRRQASGRAPALLVDDAAVPAPGQVRLREFVASVRPQVCAAVDEVLAPAGLQAEGCPYLDLVFPFVTARGAAWTEEVLQRLAPGSTAMTSADDYVPLLVERATATAKGWLATGRLEGLPAGLPTSVLAAAVGGRGAIHRKARPGSGNEEADAAQVRSRLGPGQPLHAPLRHRLERAFVAPLDHVRTHTGREAGQLSEGLGARAFAVDNHIAFGPDEYRPGSPSGDALIAHEVAHVLQQGGATQERPAPGASPSKEPALEHDADRAAVAAVASMWSSGRTGTTGAARLPAQARPRLLSGLGLQRCIEHHDVARDEMATMISEHGLSLTMTPDPGTGVSIVGQDVRFDVVSGIPEGEHPSLHVTKWRVQSAGGGDTEHHPRPMTPLELRIVEPGQHVVTVDVSLLFADNNAYTVQLERTVTAVTPERRSQELAASTKPQSFEQLMDAQQVMRSLLRPGDQQQAAGDFRINAAAPNPSRAGPDGPSLAFSVERVKGAGPVRYHWYLVPMNWEGLGDDYGGHPKVTTSEGPAFDLGTGANTSWTAPNRNLFVVRCVVEDDAGHRLDEVRYLQSVLDAAGIAELEKFERYMSRATTMIGRLHPDHRIPVAGVHVATATNAPTELRMFIGRAAKDAPEVVLLDLTPGLDPEEHTLEYRGRSAEAVMGAFDDENRYPEGAINLIVPPNDLNITAGRWEFETEGASLLGLLSGRFGLGALALGVLGLALAPFTEGGSLLVTALVVGSIGAGITSGVLSILDRTNTEELNVTGVVIDVASIAGSFLGGAAAVRIARGGASVLVAGRTTRYLLWAGFMSDAVGGLLVTVEGMQQIETILNRSDLSPEERRGQIIRLVTTLIVTGGLLALAHKDLTSAKRKVRTGLGAELDGALSDQTRLTLGNLLDDATLVALRGATTDDIERLARILREDPTAAARIPGLRAHLREALTAGAASPLDLEYAVLRRRLSSSGMPEPQNDRLTAALRAAGLPGPALSRVQGDVEASLRKLDDALASGDMTAAINLVDALPADLFSADARRALETTLARSHGRTDPGVYRKPAATVGTKSFAPTGGGTAFYGASGDEMRPELVFEHGLPARGPNTDVQAHVNENKVDGVRDTAFRGTTPAIIAQGDDQGAAYWAGAGGWVYKLDGVPSWNANKLLEGRVEGIGGFGGNVVRGEQEDLILAHVPPSRIVGAYPILEGRGLNLKPGDFIPNPNYTPR